ncbi:hypothetical protein [Kordia sp.]|uniref:hypothetical protein n=1 Tax=Kordia sp. TaxID=1965332 RepID=UPI003D6A0D98
MKKERKLKLEVNKVSVSKLNNVKGGVDPVGSVILCQQTVECDTLIDGDCKTFVTLIGTLDRC